MSEKEEKIKELIFSAWYPKLNESFFPTLRKRKQCAIGEKVIVRIKGLPEKTFFAKLLELIPEPLIYFTDEFLKYDTNTKTRKEAMKVLGSFYRNELTDKTKLYLHLFVKVAGDDK